MTADTRLDDDLSPRAVAAVLAVKSLARAKSRLAAADRASDRRGGPAHHRSLVLAMLLDTISAANGGGVGRVVVVSPDDAVLDAVTRVGAVAVRESESGGLNRALAVGADAVRQRWPDTGRIAFLQADLPAATGSSIATVLALGVEHAQSFLADHAGTGTALLIREAGDRSATLFGADSARAHRDAGATELDPSGARWADLRTDVDTASDLESALRLGVGAHTAAVLADTPLAASDAPDHPALPDPRRRGLPVNRAAPM